MSVDAFENISEISAISKWLVSPLERWDSLQNTFGKHEKDETDFNFFI